MQAKGTKAADKTGMNNMKGRTNEKIAVVCPEGNEWSCSGFDGKKAFSRMI